jgi:hypothetical protein
MNGILSRVNPTSPRFLAAMVCGLVLLASVFLPWLSPKASIGALYGSSSGMSVSALIGAAGIIGGLAAAGVVLLPARTKGWLHIVIGVLALGALVLVIFNGSLPLRSQIVRMYVNIGFGYIFRLAALA